MSAEESAALTREDVLDGLFAGHARAAGACLLAIESRTAFLVARSRQAMERFLTEQAAEEREMAFLEALALGRDPPLRPTIQDLERYAAQWASLVPENPMVQAAVVHLLGGKYRFRHEGVPGICSALGLDTGAVQEAYRRLYREPLDSVFSARADLRDRVRWAWAAFSAWLESLSPFWTAFSLTLTETVGAGILALPIALAGVGPLVGVVLLLVLGLVNVLTILAVVEALTRNGNVRFGEAYFGRLVAEYLGGTGSLVLSLALLVLGLGSLLARYIGLAATLRDATRVPAHVWVGLLFLIGLYFLRRNSLNATVAVALLVGAVNIGLVLIISLITVAQVGVPNLHQLSLPSVSALSFEPSVLGLIFGVVLLAYFGHTSAGNCARIVLSRDPSGRSLVWGNVTAMLSAIGLYSLWFVVVDGAIGQAKLGAETGTVLTPLAVEVGPAVFLLGSIFVVLALGMGSIHDSLGLLNQIRERLPRRGRRVVILPRRRGRLLLRASSGDSGSHEGAIRLGLTYLGLAPGIEGPDANPRFRLDVEEDGSSHHLEMRVRHSWDVADLFDQFPVLRQRGGRLVLSVLDASQEHVRLRVNSSMRLTYEGDWSAAGVSTADALALDDLQLEVLTLVVRSVTGDRESLSLTELTEVAGQSRIAIRTILDALARQGFIDVVKERGETRYRPTLVSRRARRLPEGIERALVDGEDKPARPGLDRGLLVRAREAMLGDRGRFVISVSPVILIFLLAEWLFLGRRESFAGPLGFTGTIAATIVSGVFPLLMLVASRRKGDLIPGLVFRFLGHPFFVTALYLFFVASLFLHGTVIWQSPSQRAAALAVALLILAATMLMRRRGSFAQRLVVELRQDLRERGQPGFAITAGGSSLITDVRLAYPDAEQEIHAASGGIPTVAALRHASFELPASQTRELKVWAHRINADGDFEGVPALLMVEYDGGKQQIDLGLHNGQVVLPWEGKACRLTVTLRDRGLI